MSNDDLKKAVKVIEDLLIDPDEGLSPDLFRLVSRVTPLVNVDLLVQDKNLGTLLTWRPRGNYASGWHVPGGIIRVRETFGQRLEKVAMLELGARATFDAKPIAINEMIHNTADTRVHFVSFLYGVVLYGGPKPELQYREGTPKPGQWFWHTQCPDDLYESQNVYRSYINDHYHKN